MKRLVFINSWIILNLKELQMSEINKYDKEECNFCGFETKLKTYKKNFPENEEMICELCSSTFIPQINRQKSDYMSAYHIRLLSRSISYIGNKILAEISELKEIKNVQ